MIDFTVTPDGGTPFEVKATSRDIYMWEKTDKTHRRNMRMLLTEMPMAELYPLAHIAARRKGLYTSDFEEFERTCDLSFALEEDEPDPTQPAVSAGPSSSSPSVPESPLPFGQS
jgi:hypothetical protein